MKESRKKYFHAHNMKFSASVAWLLQFIVNLPKKYKIDEKRIL